MSDSNPEATHEELAMYLAHCFGGGEAQIAELQATFQKMSEHSLKATVFAVAASSSPEGRDILIGLIADPRIPQSARSTFTFILVQAGGDGTQRLIKLLRSFSGPDCYQQTFAVATALLQHSPTGLSDLVQLIADDSTNVAIRAYLASTLPTAGWAGIEALRPFLFSFPDTRWKHSRDADLICVHGYQGILDCSSTDLLAQVIADETLVTNLWRFVWIRHDSWDRQTYLAKRLLHMLTQPIPAPVRDRAEQFVRLIVRFHDPDSTRLALDNYLLPVNTPDPLADTNWVAAFVTHPRFLAIQKARLKSFELPDDEHLHDAQSEFAEKLLTDPRYLYEKLQRIDAFFGLLYSETLTVAKTIHRHASAASSALPLLELPEAQSIPRDQLERLIREEETEEVALLLRILPELDRNMIERTVVDEMSFNQAAKLLDVNYKTLNRKVKKILLLWRRIFESHDD